LLTGQYFCHFDYCSWQNSDCQDARKGDMMIFVTETKKKGLPQTNRIETVADLSDVGEVLRQPEIKRQAELQAEDIVFEALIQKLIFDQTTEDPNIEIKKNFKIALELAKSEQNRRRKSKEAGVEEPSKSLKEIFAEYLYGDLEQYPGERKENAMFTRLLMADGKEQAQKLNESQVSAATDALTEIPNRREILKTLRKWLESDRTDDQNFAVVVIDLDHFKEINDTYGHNVGDIVLKSFAGFLNNHFRSAENKDAIGRYGGEEFLVLIKADKTKVAEILKRFLDGLRNFEIKRENEPPIKITASIGWTMHEAISSPITSEDIIKQADSAMYFVKKNGRNNVAKYEEGKTQLVNMKEKESANI